MNCNKNPICPHAPVRLITTFDTQVIIKLYAQQAGIDVKPYLAGLDFVELYECSATGYRFYYPFELAGPGEFYSKIQEVQGKSGVDYYRGWSYDNEFAVKSIRPGDHILEIGCGTGKFYEGIKHVLGSYTGLELNKEAIRIATGKGINAIYELVEDHCKSHIEEYDLVCAFQVLEHINDVKSFLDSSLSCLKPGGHLVIGVPNNEPYFQRFNKYETFNLPPHHMGLWNLNAFRSLEKYFPVKLINFAYAPVNERVVVDAYLRAKLWTGVKSLPRRHSFWDKFKMLGLAPVTLPLSFFRRYSKGINGAYIAVAFEKIV